MSNLYLVCIASSNEYFANGCNSDINNLPLNSGQALVVFIGEEYVERWNLVRALAALHLGPAVGLVAAFTWEARINSPQHPEQQLL